MSGPAFSSGTEATAGRIRVRFTRNKHEVERPACSIAQEGASSGAVCPTEASFDAAATGAVKAAHPPGDHAGRLRRSTSRGFAETNLSIPSLHWPAGVKPTDFRFLTSSPLR